VRIEDLDACVLEMRGLCLEDWGTDADEALLRYFAAVLLRMAPATGAGFMRQGLDVGRIAERLGQAMPDVHGIGR
jgi:hypothetical protein